MQKSKLTLAVVGALFAMSAEAGSYVLQANKWGAEQEAAVAAAGGTVIYASADAGIAVVDSDNAGFLDAVRNSRTVVSALADMPVQWTQPTPVDELNNPGNDPFYTHIQWAPQSIEAPAAWALGFNGQGVRVAVIDGGIYDAHADFEGTAVDVAASRSFVPGAAGSCQVRFNCDTGTFWHGTHVAGIIAARDNNLGVVGIAPRATIVGVKALHGGTGSFGSVIAAILYAATEGGADIINMSLGAEFPRNEEGAAALHSALNRAVNFATARGSLVVVSAGNSGLDTDKTANLIVTPAESGNAIAISATGPLLFAAGATDFSRPASYSNYGSLVWVAGPGGDFAYPGNENCLKGGIVRPCWVFDMVLSTARGTTAAGAYSWAAGTSMSAPAVSAVAALIKQRDPGATPSQLKARLAKSATDEGKVGTDSFYGRGFVNARRAVTE